MLADVPWSVCHHFLSSNPIKAALPAWGAFLNVFITQKITGYALANEWSLVHFLPLGNTLTALRPMTSPAIKQLKYESACD